MLYEFYTPNIYLYYLLLSLSVGFSFISIFILIPALFYYVNIVTNVILIFSLLEILFSKIIMFETDTNAEEERGYSESCI